MKKPIYYLLWGAFSIILIEAIILAVAFFFISKLTKADINTDFIVISPNKEYRTVGFTSMGGGAAGFCDQKISIINNNEDTTQNNTLYSNVIFTLSCTEKMNAFWENDTVLNIEYTENGNVTISKLKNALNNKVEIKYTQKK